MCGGERGGGALCQNERERESKSDEKTLLNGERERGKR